ncbi:hypothetical protein T35B1_11712 [Salinisphaera shabanensis T35B1]|uniref:PRTRC system protein C n=1 Tax=Salinisphaera TaxID=180541 RepID=UPI00333E7CEE
MTAITQTLTRVFKLGATELDDPAPQESPEIAMSLYETAFPVLKSASLAEPVIDGERLVYEIVKPQAKTKG